MFQMWLQGADLMEFLKYLIFNKTFNPDTWIEPYLCLDIDYLRSLEKLKIIDLVEIENTNPKSSHFKGIYVRIKPI
jgi:hypothetical protein